MLKVMGKETFTVLAENFCLSKPMIFLYVYQVIKQHRIHPSFICFYFRWNKNLTVSGTKLFTGGFLGLDNISVFNRSKSPLKDGFFLAQVSVLCSKIGANRL